MTKSESILKAIKIWTYLSENPDASKEQAYSILNLDMDDCSCPLCEYDLQFEDNCQNCPAYDQWGYDGNIVDTCSGSDDNQTPYYNWLFTDKGSEDRITYSKDMVNLLKNLK